MQRIQIRAGLLMNEWRVALIVGLVLVAAYLAVKWLASLFF